MRVFGLLLSALIVLVFPCALGGEELGKNELKAYDSIRPMDAYDYCKKISSHEFAGRLTGDEGLHGRGEVGRLEVQGMGARADRREGRVSAAVSLAVYDRRRGRDDASLRAAAPRRRVGALQRAEAQGARRFHAASLRGERRYDRGPRLRGMGHQRAGARVRRLRGHRRGRESSCSASAARRTAKTRRSRSTISTGPGCEPRRRRAPSGSSISTTSRTPIRTETGSRDSCPP